MFTICIVRQLPQLNVLWLLFLMYIAGVHNVQSVGFMQHTTYVGSGVVRIDQLCFLAGFRTRRLNQHRVKLLSASMKRCSAS